MKRKLAISISILAVILICLSACGPVDAPTITVNSSEGTITITQVTGAEYSIDGGQSFQTSNVFKGLTPGEYKVTGRIAASGNKKASDMAPIQTVYVQGKQESFTITAITDRQFGDAPFQVVASGGDSKATLKFSIVSGPATITDSGMLTITGVGTVTVQAVSSETTTSLATTAQARFTVTKAAQAAFTVNEVTGKVVGDEFQLATTGTKGNGAVTYSVVSGSAYASVDANGKVTALGAGSFTVKAIIASDSQYLAGESSTRTITIGRAEGSISIAAISTLEINTPATINVTGPGTGAVTYAISGTDADAASIVDGNKISFNRSATVTLTATRAQDANYTQATASIQVTANTAFRFKAYETEIRLNDEIVLETEGGAGKGAVTLTIKAGYTSTAQVMSNGKIKILAPSEFIVVATKAAEGTNPSQTIEKSFIAKRALQDPIYVATTPEAKFNTPFDLNVTGGSVTGSPITYEIVKDANFNNAVIDSNGKIVPKSMNSFTVTATKAGNTLYEDVTVQYTVTNISKASVTLAISTTLVDPQYGSTYDLTGANAVVTVTGAELNAITFSVETVVGTNVASIVNNNQVRINGKGTFKIVATIASSANYESSSAKTEEINTVEANQAALTYTISYAEGLSDIAVGDTFFITVSGGSGTGALTIRDMESTGRFTATLAGNVFTVTANESGTIPTEIMKAGDGNYNDAFAYLNINVTGYRQKALTITNPGTLVYHAAPDYTTFTPEVKQDGTKLNNTTLTIKVISAGTLAEYVGGKVVIYGAGTITVTATKAGYTADGKTYRDETATLVLTVNKANQAPVVITGVPADIRYGDTFTPGTTGGSTGNPATFNIYESTVATVGSGNVVKIVGVGSFTLRATIPGDENYNDGVTLGTYTATAQDNTGVAFKGPFAFQYKDANHQVEFENNASTGRIEFSVKSLSVTAGSLSLTTTGILQFNGVGTITVQAVIKGDGKVGDTTLTHVYTVDKADQTGFAFTTYPAGTVGYGTQFTALATGGQTSGAVTYSVSNDRTKGKVISATAGTFEATSGEGRIEITALRAGNDFYKDAYATHFVDLIGADQRPAVYAIYDLSGASPVLAAAPGSTDYKIRYGEEFGVYVYGYDFFGNGQFDVSDDGSKSIIDKVSTLSVSPVGDYTRAVGYRFVASKGIGRASIVITLSGNLSFTSQTFNAYVTVIESAIDFKLINESPDNFTEYTSAKYGETFTVADDLVTPRAFSTDGTRANAYTAAQLANLDVKFELANSTDRQYIEITNGGKGLRFVSATTNDIVVNVLRVANGYYSAKATTLKIKGIAKADQKLVYTITATSPDGTVTTFTTDSVTNKLNATLKVGDKFTVAVASKTGTAYPISMWSKENPTWATASFTPTTAGSIKWVAATTGANATPAHFLVEKVDPSIVGNFTVPGGTNFNAYSTETGAGSEEIVIVVGKGNQAAFDVYFNGTKLSTLTDKNGSTIDNAIEIKYLQLTALQKAAVAGVNYNIYAEGGTAATNATGAFGYAVAKTTKAADGKDGTYDLSRYVEVTSAYEAAWGCKALSIGGSAMDTFKMVITKTGNADYNDLKQTIYIKVIPGDAPELPDVSSTFVIAGYGSTLNKEFYEGKSLFESNVAIGYGEITTNVVSDPENIIANNKIVATSSTTGMATVTVTKSGTFKHPGVPAKEAAFKFFEDATSGEFYIKSIKGQQTELEGKFEVKTNYYVGVTYRLNITKHDAAATGAITVTGAAANYAITKVSETQFDVRILTSAGAGTAPLTITKAGDANYNAATVLVANPEFKKNNYVPLMMLQLVGSDGETQTLYSATNDPTAVFTLKYGVKYVYTILDASDLGTYTIATSSAFEWSPRAMWVRTSTANPAGTTGSFTIEQEGNANFNAGTVFDFNYVVAKGPQAPIYFAGSGASDFSYLTTGNPTILLTTVEGTYDRENSFSVGLSNPITDANFHEGRLAQAMNRYKITIDDPDEVITNDTWTTGWDAGFNDGYYIMFPARFAKPGSFTITLTIPGNNYYEELVYSETIVVGKAAQGAISTNGTYDSYVAAGLFKYGSAVNYFTIADFLTQAAYHTDNAYTYSVDQDYAHIVRLNGDGTFSIIGAGEAKINVTRPGNETYADATFELVIDVVAGAQTITFANSVTTLTFKEYYTPAELLNLTNAKGDIVMTIDMVSKANIAHANNTGSGNNLFLYGIGTFRVTFQAAAVANQVDGYYDASNTIDRIYEIVAADQPAMTINETLIGDQVGTTYTLQTIQAGSMVNAPVVWKVEVLVGEAYVAVTPAQATVSASTLTVLQAGTYKITATREGKILATPNYDASEDYYNTATANVVVTFA